MSTPKKSARDPIDQMPEEAFWDDIMYELYVKQKIESGIQDVSDGRVADHQDIKPRLLQRKRLAS